MKAEIEKALFEHVLALILAPSLPIQFPNLTFPQPDNGRWLEIVHLPNDVLDTLWDTENPGVHRGLLRILVHYSSDIGTVVVANIIDRICAHFAKGTTLESDGVRVRVTSQPSNASWVRTKDETFMPVTVSYQTI